MGRQMTLSKAKCYLHLRGASLGSKLDVESTFYAKYRRVVCPMGGWPVCWEYLLMSTGSACTLAQTVGGMRPANRTNISSIFAPCIVAE